MAPYEWIGGGGQAVELEHVHEIVELAVDVAAHGELFALGDRHVHQRRLRLEQLHHVQQNLCTFRSMKNTR